MASFLPYLFFIAIICQNVLSQVIPIGNGCFCTKPAVPQKQLINLQLPTPGCTCQNSNGFPFNNLQLNNWPINKSPAINGLQINNGLPLNLNNRLPFTSPPNFNLPVVNNLPSNVPVYKNIPLASLPLFNGFPFGNLPMSNLPITGLQINNVPAGNRLPAYNNVYNTVPVNNNMPNNINLIPNFIQVPNANPLAVFNNVPFQNNNINKQPQNYNVIQPNNYPIGLPNNIQYTNLPPSQANSVQYTNVPNGFQFNQLQNANQQSFQNVPVNDCGCNQGLSALFENPGNGLANSGNNLANSNLAPVVSMNGLQLGGVGGLGNLPLFNGLPVIGVQESVVNLNNNNQCTCQN